MRVAYNDKDGRTGMRGYVQFNKRTHTHTHTHTHTQRRKERVDPVTADPDNLENNKEAGGEA